MSGPWTALFVEHYVTVALSGAPNESIEYITQRTFTFEPVA